jgi:hypothetical protein
MINIKPPIDARKRTPDRTLMLIISGQRAARAPPADRNAAEGSRSAAVVLGTSVVWVKWFMGHEFSCGPAGEHCLVPDLGTALRIDAERSE